MEVGDEDAVRSRNGNSHVTTAGFMEIESSLRNGHWWVEVRGEVDFTTVHALEAALRERAALPVILDLGGVEFMDSSGIRVLVRTAGRISVGRVSPPVERLIHLCGLETELRFIGEDDSPPIRVPPA